MRIPSAVLTILPRNRGTGSNFYDKQNKWLVHQGCVIMILPLTVVNVCVGSTSTTVYKIKNKYNIYQTVWLYRFIGFIDKKHLLLVMSYKWDKRERPHDRFLLLSG